MPSRRVGSPKLWMKLSSLAVTGIAASIGIPALNRSSRVVALLPASCVVHRGGRFNFQSKFHEGFQQQFASSTTRLFSGMSVPLIDVDCNLWHQDLRSIKKSDDAKILDILDEDAVQESNIVAMLSPSSTIDEAEEGLRLLSQYASSSCRIRTTVGVHPYHVNDDSEGTVVEHMQRAKTLLESNRDLVVSVGECGLDASEGFPSIEDQLPWFQHQVELAQELQLPLFVHERLAHQQTLDVLKDCTLPIIIHCFTGNQAECQTYIDRGYSISVSGFIAKEAGNEVRLCLENGLIPLDKLMVETDAPYMGFPGCRDEYVKKQSDYVGSLNAKKRKRLVGSTYPNVPSSLSTVLDNVLVCLNKGRTDRGEECLGRDQLALQTAKNANAFFNFDLDL